MNNPYEAPQQQPMKPGAAPQATPDSTGGIIPYKNPHALIAYYLAIFGMFPCIGVVLSLPAFILGIIGLQKRKQNPAISGAVHAWIGIIVGGLFSLCHIGGIIMIVIAIAAEA